MNQKRLTILGSTGSIGVNSLDIVRKFPDRFCVYAISCNKNIEKISEQINEFKPEIICVNSDEDCDFLKRKYPKITVVKGQEGLVQISSEPKVDLVVCGIVGAAGLRPVFSAVECGKTIAIANKEPIVMAGEILMEKALENGSLILPMDSEHNAIFQSLMGHNHSHIKKIILTASGGPFREKPLSEFPSITLKEALNHPNWNMGNKITIDSATMMNKGLEVIEARWLFDIPVEQIEVVIHPQSIIHSLIEYIDGSLIAQLGLPDMRIPIAFTLSYPDRLPLDLPKLDLAYPGKFDFHSVSFEKFPCLKIAINASKWGHGAPAVLNGANEKVVETYLQGKLKFLEISQILDKVMIIFEKSQKNLSFNSIRTIEDALEADKWGRNQAQEIIGKILRNNK